MTEFTRQEVNAGGGVYYRTSKFAVCAEYGQDNGIFRFGLYTKPNPKPRQGEWVFQRRFEWAPFFIRPLYSHNGTYLQVCYSRLFGVIHEHWFIQE